MKKRFTEDQIIGFMREAEAGLPIKELCRQHGFSEASYYGNPPTEPLEPEVEFSGIQIIWLKS